MNKYPKILIGLLSVIFISILIINSGFIKELLLGEGMERQFDGNTIDEWEIINLSIPFDKNSVMIFENDRVILLLGYDKFLEYKEMRKGFTIADRDLINLENAFLSNNYGALVQTDIDLVSDLTAKGKVFIFDKANNYFVDSIKMHYVDVIWCPVCGQGSINFYFIDNTELLKGPTWNF